MKEKLSKKILLTAFSNLQLLSHYILKIMAISFLLLSTLILLLLLNINIEKNIIFILLFLLLISFILTRILINKSLIKLATYYLKIEKPKIPKSFLLSKQGLSARILNIKETKKNFYLLELLMYTLYSLPFFTMGALMLFITQTDKGISYIILILSLIFSLIIKKLFIDPYIFIKLIESNK